MLILKIELKINVIIFKVERVKEKVFPNILLTFQIFVILLVGQYIMYDMFDWTMFSSLYRRYYSLYIIKRYSLHCIIDITLYILKRYSLHFIIEIYGDLNPG